MAGKPSRYYPIIYVRGYAMTPNEIDETTADPFCGFNLGSTVYRAVPEKDRPPRKYIFESPVVRLASDFGYCDVYEDGYDILDPEWSANPDNVLARRSIIIYRYYDESSRLLGTAQPTDIRMFARKLGELILRVRELVCANPENRLSPDAFRCYLVAHSMGGLVCRGLLQNPKLDKKNARRFVDKFFTYATPHDGIDMGGINVPGWLKLWDVDTFNRGEMADFLDLKSVHKKTDSVAWMPEDRFSPERIFCMVGTNRLDYEVALGISRTFAGHGSDGLVRIENATLKGLKANGQPGVPCAKAFAYRAHSGFFGIVNSEEAYQNLTRFLFGDVRVDIWVDVEEIRLPAEVQAAADAGRTVNALYQFEVLASPRGKLWFLTRRTAEEDSVACIAHADWAAAPKKQGSEYLSTVFLAKRAKVKPERPSLAYSLSLGVRVPDYEIDRKLWVNEHYEGGYVFRNAIILELVPPADDAGQWKVKYAWQGKGTNLADTSVDPRSIKAGKVEVTIPFDSETTPGMKGRLRFVVSAWNPDTDDDG
jgi:hypothetical protein